MMHSFQIANYLSKKIVDLKIFIKTNPVKRRSIRAQIDFLKNDKSNFSVASSFDDSIEMLLVNGSSQYKSWLKRYKNITLLLITLVDNIKSTKKN